MEIIGKTTIHPALFYSGKIAGYITWIVYLLLLCGVFLFEMTVWFSLAAISFATTLAGLVFIILSMINLGKSTRLGLPSGETQLKTNGLYAISRNPMYVGFNLLTLSSMIYTHQLVVLILGCYSIVVYHLIILAEEKFLEQRFGVAFEKYRSATMRYL